MSSTFAEIYSEFQDAVKIYTTKLDITPLSFMRRLSRGMRHFQRETEYIQAAIILPIDANNLFTVPNDLNRIIELKDDNGYTIVPQQNNQFFRNQEHWLDGKLETPSDYSIRMQNYLRGQATFNPNRSLSRPGMSRMYTLYNRVITIYPDYGDTSLDLYYIPNIDAISQNSTQWVRDPANPGNDPLFDWYPITTQFDNRFRTSTLHPDIAPYEEAFLNYAIADYIKSQGSANYKVFEQVFLAEVERAKVNKPTYFKEGVRDYFMAPWS